MNKYGGSIIKLFVSVKPMSIYVRDVCVDIKIMILFGVI